MFEFKTPWKRYGMIETLEEKLDVKFLPGDMLHTDERTNARLLDKVRFI